MVELSNKHEIKRLLVIRGLEKYLETYPDDRWLKKYIDEIVHEIDQVDGFADRDGKLVIRESAWDDFAMGGGHERLLALHQSAVKKTVESNTERSFFSWLKRIFAR